MNGFFLLLKRAWYVLALSMLLCAALGVGLSILQPQRYSSEASLLVVQHYVGDMGAVEATASAQRTAETLADIVHTTSFQHAAIANARYKVLDDFPKDPGLRMRAWDRTVHTDASAENGVLHISVSHKQRSQARALAYSVAGTLIERAQDYHGGGQTISLKLVDEPVTSLHITTPNPFVYGFVGALVGLLLGAVMARLLRPFVLQPRRRVVLPAESSARAPQKQQPVRSSQEAEGYRDIRVMPTIFPKSSGSKRLHADPQPEPAAPPQEPVVESVAEPEDDDEITIPAGLDEELKESEPQPQLRTRTSVSTKKKRRRSAQRQEQQEQKEQMVSFSGGLQELRAQLEKRAKEAALSQVADPNQKPKNERVPSNA